MLRNFITVGDLKSMKTKFKNNSVCFYYGMSGTFKTSTIQNKNKLNLYPVVWSMIKLWKDLEVGEFKGDIIPNHLNFALLHLCNLSNILKLEETKSSSTILVERGVTDPLFYYGQLSDERISEIEKREEDLCNSYLPNCAIEKILLIQEDVEFIEKVILNEPHRRAIFPDVDSYMKKQEEYINFTRKYNNITKTIKIENAKEYLGSLGITFKKEG